MKVKPSIKENPDTVSRKPGLENDLYFNTRPNVGFIIYSVKSNQNKIKYVYTKNHLTGDVGPHFKCRDGIKSIENIDVSSYAMDDFITEWIRGRIWPEHNIASTYECKSNVSTYKIEIESIFKELNFDITKYKWEFGNDDDKSFDNWFSVSNQPHQKKEVDPKLKKEIDDLIMSLHTATPDEKIKIRKLIKIKQEQTGISDSEISSYIAASQEKIKSAFGNRYDNIAQARFNRGSIAESVLRVYNKTLDPNIWNSDKTINPEIRDSLLKIAEDFYNSTDLNGEIHDILLIGSSANYNWTPSSDIDLHIVIDIAEEKINEEYARKFMDGLAFKWNTEHDIELKKHPVEVYLQDIREPNSNAQLSRDGAAIYSLFDGKWLQEPNMRKIDLDADKIRKKFQSIQLKAKNLIDTSNIEKLKELMKSIRNYRDAGLSAGGEFSIENLVFKALRKTEVLKQIKDTINTVYDKQVSLPENGNMQPSTDTTPLNEDSRPYTLVGCINDDNEVISIKDYKDEKGHNGLRGYRNGNKRWRYNSKRNTVYWDYFGGNMGDEEDKYIVDIHLQKKYGIVNPTHKISGEYYSHGHQINELIESTMSEIESMGDRLFFK